MGALRVTGIVECLLDHAPLNGEVGGCRDAETLVDAPRDGAVIHDDVVGIVEAEAVALMESHLPLSEAEAHVTDDGILAGDGDGIVGKADAIARSRLSEDSKVAAVEVERRREVNGTADGKGDNLTPRLLDGPSEGASF